MTSISVIIPTIDEAERICELIAALTAQGFDDIIIADASHDDATYLAARSTAATCLRLAEKGRGAQMQAGAQLAKGDILLFLHADSHLPDGAKAAITTAMARSNVVAGSFRLAFDVKHPLLSLYAWCSHANTILTTYGDQGLFVGRATFDRVGGFKPMPLLEDLEIQSRLRPLGQFVKLDLAITTSARRFLRRGIIKQQVLNVAIVLAYHLGVSPKILARWYAGRPQKPARSP
jgi:rSAM/selenodomain-associated transferase 2